MSWADLWLWLALAALIWVLARAWRRRGRGARAAQQRRAAEQAPGQGDAAGAFTFAAPDEAGAHVPWIAVVGAPGAATEALASSLPDVAGRSMGGLAPRLERAAVRLTEVGALVDMGDRVMVDEDGPGRFEALVGALARQRGRRPLDAVVVVVPAGLLTGAEPERGERLLGLGRAVRDVLWRVERATGMRVPVTLLVAADASLPGAADLALALDRSPDRGALGWAAGDGIAAVDRDGVAAGLEDAALRLDRLVVEVLARPPEAIDTEGAGRLMRLPGRFREVATGLEELADHLLLPIAYREPMLLRGMYVTLPKARGSGVRLVRELFARRVAPEIRLAMPARAAEGLRRRQIRVVRAGLAVFALLGVAGWSWLWLDRADRLSVEALLGSLARDLGAVRNAPFDQDLVEGTAINLIGALSNLSAETVESNLAPTSHLTGATGRVVDAISVGYRFALLQATARQLQEIKVDAARADLGIAAAGRPGAEDRMRATLAMLAQLRAQIAAYRTLNRGRDVAALGGVIGFAFATELPPAFNENSDLYAGALEGASLPAISTERIGERLMPALEASFAGLVQARFVASGPIAALDLVAPSATRGAATMSSAALANSIEALHRLREELAREPDWLARGPGTLPPDVRELLDALGTLCPPGNDVVCLTAPGFAERMRAQVLAAVDAQRARLQNQPIFGVSPPVVGDGDGLRLAPTLEAAEAAIDAYFREIGFEVTGGSLLSLAPPGTVDLAWDVTGLDRLLDITGGLLVVDAEAFDRVPPVLATAARALAERRLGELVGDELRSATMRGRGGAGGSEAAALGFTLASSSLGALHGRLRQLGMTELATRLDAVVRPQARSMLERAERERLRQGLYVPFDPTLASWDGGAPVIFAAFNAPTAAELPGVLARWRLGLGDLVATHAGPALAYVDAVGGREDATERRWRTVVQRLDTYEAQLPDNTLVQFERFVLEQLPTLTPDDCRSLPPVPAGDDFFREQQRRLALALVDRCLTLEGTLFIGAYGELADAFNDSLAGRFPFAAPDGSLAAMADPGAVRRFFEGPGADLDRLRAMGEGVVGGGDALRFLDRLAAARLALAPLLEPPADLATLAYEVRADYRPLPNLDRGGEQVIEGWMEAADRRAGSFDEADTLLWRHGELFRLGLRWANRAPMQPAPASGRPVSDRTVLLEDRSPWALFRLAARWTAEGVRGGGDLLGFTVPLEPNPERGAGGRDDLEEAELYVDLLVTALVPTADGGSRRQPVRLTGFPHAAPSLDRWTGGLGR